MPSDCCRWRRRVHWTSSNALGWTCNARRSPSRCTAAERLRPPLLRAAKQLEQLDADLAGETYLDALLAAMFAGALASGVSVREAAEAARAAYPRSRSPRPPDLLLDGLAVRFSDGYGPAVPLLKRALQAFRDHDLSVQEELRWLWHACITAAHLFDGDTWELLATRFVQTARETGALTMLPLALSQRIGVHVFLGELTEATSLREELNSVIEATGDPPPPIANLPLAAWQGRVAEALDIIETTTVEVLRRGEGDGLIKAQWAAALLYNSLGRYHDALSAAQKASDHPPVLGVAPGRRCPNSSKRPPEVACPNSAHTPSSSSPRSPTPAAVTGRWASKPAPERC